MEHNYWSIERWRFVLTLFGGFLGGLLTGYWLISFIITLLAYITWLLYKLQQLHNWLEKGGNPAEVPDSNGIWERINSHIQNTRKKSDRRKQHFKKLLKRFQGIITSLPYATVVLTGNNEIDWANKTSTNLLRLNLRTDRGQRIDNLIRMPKIHKLLLKNKQKEIEISAPYDEQTKLALQLIPIEKDMKLLIARDISERVQLQQMRKNFIANASHELRTPLTVIAGYLEIMQGETALPDHLIPAVQAASEQADRMQNIIEDLLTLSRLENSELDEHKTKVISLASIIQGICNSEASLIGTHIIDSSNVDSNIELNGAETEIVSVCNNLIHNAIRYTPQGTLITVTWQPLSTGEALFSVEDNGEGIANKHLSRLTERFYRIDKGRSRDQGGTGLGLAIVQHIVQRHGGRLNISSEIGKGSIFSVVFPENRIVVASDLLSQTS